MTYQFNKIINSERLRIEIAAAGLPAPSLIETVSSDAFISFGSELTAEQVTSLTNVITAHVHQTTVEYLSNYLDNQVFPFVKDLIRTFAAENISMGITQAGKTGHVLSLFSKKYPIPSSDFQNCIKDSFDTGSLYVSLSLLQHVRDNPSEFSSLSPFITDSRLLSMKNKIEAFLGVTLST